MDALVRQGFQPRDLWRGSRHSLGVRPEQIPTRHRAVLETFSMAKTFESEPPSYLDSLDH